MRLDRIAEIYQQLNESANSMVLYEEVLTEDRIDWLKSKYPEINTSHDPSAAHKSSGHVIDFLAGHMDPTKNKSYSQWLVNRYHSGGFRQEDAPRVHQALSDFEQNKKHLAPEQRDIGRYKRVSDVQAAVAPFAGKGDEEIKSQGMAAKQQEEQHPGFEKKYEDENITIHHLTNEDTSKKLFGRPRTEWCTAWEGNSCRFKHYTEHDQDAGPLFVVTRKHDNAVFQYHPTSNQFMDRDDNTIGQEDLNSIKPSLHKAWAQDRSLLAIKE